MAFVSPVPPRSSGRSPTAIQPAAGINLAPQSPTPEDPALNSPLRHFAFALSAALVFLRFSMLHQIQTMLLHVNLRLLYVVGIPALLGLLLAGGIHRSFKGRPAYYFAAYALWIALAVPFSSWRGGSVTLLWTYLRTDAVMLFMIAGIALTWKECRVLMWAVALGAVVNLLSTRLFASESQFGYREGLQFGSVSNPNDFAAHLLLTIPFLLWIALGGARNLIVRIAAFGGVLFGLKVILGTASRGALVGIVAAGLYFLWRGTARQRIGFLLLVPVALVGAIIVLPTETLNRLVAFNRDTVITTDQQKEALESSRSREYVLRKSIEYMLTYPVFGVGPGQFSSFEGRHNVVLGTHGYWHETHNSFTQAGSECGIPAALFLLGGTISTFLLLNKSYAAASRRPDCRDLRIAAFCMSIAMAGFAVASAFLNFAYFFYFPAMGGFAILLHHAVTVEIRRRSDLALSPQPVLAVRQPILRPR